MPLDDSSFSSNDVAAAAAAAAKMFRNMQNQHQPQHPYQPMDGNVNVATASVQDIVDEIQQWLFLEGGNLPDVESLITEYSNFCRSKLEIPLDRIFVIAGTVMLNPTNVSVSAQNVWKWELGQDFNEHKVPHDLAFQNSNFNPDEPIAVLLEGRAMRSRMKAQTTTQYGIPPGSCAWFVRDGYQDYYALPIYHRGQVKGAMACSTKCVKGWNEEHIQVFERSLAAFSTVLRLYTNDIVTTTLTGRLEEQVQKQTIANANLAKANQKFVQQHQAQLKNFAMMSHEIRTPLNCIVGLSSLIFDDLILEDLSMRDNDKKEKKQASANMTIMGTAKLKEQMELITSSGDLLLAVVDDVLDYSKLAAGKVETNMETCTLRTTINTVVSAIRNTTCRTSNVELRTTFSNNLPKKMWTDSRRLQQILYNLLGNAMKFGKKGKVVDFTVSVVKKQTATTTTLQQRGVVVFSIKDYGKGVAPSEMNKM
jgi:nitrogen-specific signal transduction histidine kinase